MYIKRDPPGKGRMTFRKKRRRIPIIPIFLYLTALGIAGMIYLQRDSIRPQIVAMVGPTPTPTLSVPDLTAPGYAAFLEGDLAEAGSFYEQAVQVDPNNVDVLFMLAHIKSLQFVQSRNEARLDEAMAYAEQAMTADPEDPRGYAAMSRVLTWGGDPSTGANYANQALERDPNNALARAYLAEAYIDLERYNQALEQARRAIELDPYSVEARSNYANVLANFGAYNDSIVQYEQALRLQPNRIDLMYNLALVYRWNGNTEESVNTFDQIISRTTDREDLATFNLELGAVYFEVRDDGAAQEYLSQSVDITCNLEFDDPRDFLDCPRNINLWDEEEVSDAEYRAWKQDPSSAANADPDAFPNALPENLSINAWTRLGQVYLTRRNYEDTVDILEEAITYGEHNDGVQVGVEAYYVLGLAYYYLDMCDRAVPLAETALQTWEDTRLSINEPLTQGDINVQNNILGIFVLCRDYAINSYVSDASGFVNGFPQGYEEPNVIVEAPNADNTNEEDEMMDDEE